MCLAGLGVGVGAVRLFVAGETAAVRADDERWNFGDACGLHRRCDGGRGCGGGSGRCGGRTGWSGRGGDGADPASAGGGCVWFVVAPAEGEDGAEGDHGCGGGRPDPDWDAGTRAGWRLLGGGLFGQLAIDGAEDAGRGALGFDVVEDALLGSGRRWSQVRFAVEVVEDALLRRG